jgi:hypothetical protein
LSESYNFFTPSVIELQAQIRHGCIYEKAVDKRKKQPEADEETKGEPPVLEPFLLVREALGAKEVAFEPEYWSLS